MSPAAEERHSGPGMLPMSPQVAKITTSNSIFKDADIFTNSNQDQLVSYVRGVIEGMEVQILGDSGSSVSLISADLCMSIQALCNPSQRIMWWPEM